MKKKDVFIFLFRKLHNKNAKISVLENLEIKIFIGRPATVGGTFTKFPKVKISPLKISAPWQVCVDEGNVKASFIQCDNVPNVNNDITFQN